MGNRISQFPIPLISKKILKDQLSGELDIRGEGVEKRIYFTRGLCDFATTTLEKERLAEVLFRSGKIDREMLFKLNTIIAHTRSSKMVGQILQEISNLKQEDIAEGLTRQIRTIAANSFSLRQGEWVFQKKVTRAPNPLPLNLVLPGIIREGVDKITDMEYFENRFRHSYPVVVANPEGILPDFSAEEQAVLEYLDQRPEQSIAQISREFGGDVHFFWRKMITFYLLNILAFSAKNPAEKHMKQIRKEIELLSEQLIHGEINYYQVLGVPAKVKQQEIEDRYLYLISRYHPEKLARLFGESLEEELNRVVAEINAAYQVLGDPRRREDYDRKGIFLREEQEKDELLDDKKKGRRLYSHANRLYKNKQYPQCIQLLKRALAFDNTKAGYYMLLGLCQSKFPGQRREAVENFLAASRLESWNPDPLYAVSDVFRAEKLPRKAKYYLEMALEKDMEKSMSGRTVRDYRQKKGGVISFLKK